MMADDIQWPDIKIRASIQDDTGKGANSLKKNLDDLLNEQKKKREGGAGGKGVSYGRLFSDQKTTGLNPIERGVTSLVGEHLGTGLSLGVTAVVGVALSDLTAKAVTFSDKLADGKENAADIALDFGKSIPILGGFVSAGANINELFTHIARDVKIVEETTQNIVALNDQWLSLAVRVGQERRQQARDLARDERQINEIGLRGIDSQRQATIDKYKDQKDANDKAREDAKQAAENDPALKAVEAAREKFEKDHGNAKMTGPLKDEKDALDSSLKKIQDKVGEELKNKLAFLDADDAKKAQQKKKELEEQNKLHREGLKITAETADADNARAKGEAEASGLATGGNVADAAKKRIQVQIDADKASARIAAEQASNATTNAAEKATIAQQLADKLSSIDAKGRADMAAADKAAGVERRKAAYDTAESTADAEAAAHAEALREAGKGYEAERVLRERELKKQKDDIDEAAAEAIVQNKDNQKEILAKAAADKAKIDADAKEKERQAKETQISGETGIAKDLIGNRIDALKSEASVGSIAAAAEAKRLEIASQFLEKRAAINKLIRDPNVSEAEKNLAKQQLAGLDAQQQRAEQMALFTGGAATPELNISQRGSGAISKAREENSPFIMLQKIQQKNGETLSMIQKSSQALYELLNKSPVISSLLGGHA